MSANDQTATTSKVAEKSVASEASKEDTKPMNTDEELPKLVQKTDESPNTDTKPEAAKESSAKEAVTEKMAAAKEPKPAEKPAEESTASPAAAEKSSAPAPSTEQAAKAPEESCMDTSTDEPKPKLKRKASEIEKPAEEEPAKENVEKQAASTETNGDEPTVAKEKKDVNNDDLVAAKKAKTVNGAATVTKVVEGDNAEAAKATEAMPKQAPVA